MKSVRFIEIEVLAERVSRDKAWHPVQIGGTEGGGVYVLLETCKEGSFITVNATWEETSWSNLQTN